MISRMADVLNFPPAEAVTNSDLIVLFGGICLMFSLGAIAIGMILTSHYSLKGWDIVSMDKLKVSAPGLIGVVVSITIIAIGHLLG